MDGMMTAKAIMSMNTVTMMKKKAFLPWTLPPGIAGEVGLADMSGSGGEDPARYAGGQIQSILLGASPSGSAKFQASEARTPLFALPLVGEL